MHGPWQTTDFLVTDTKRRHNDKAISINQDVYSIVLQLQYKHQTHCTDKKTLGPNEFFPSFPKLLGSNRNHDAPEIMAATRIWIKLIQRKMLLHFNDMFVNQKDSVFSMKKKKHEPRKIYNIKSGFNLECVPNRSWYALRMDFRLMNNKISH